MAKNKTIVEAKELEIMTKRESKLKKVLINFLATGKLKVPDGKGGATTVTFAGPHPKYAKRLEDFILKIVSRKDDPEMTAAISWEDATIYISEGFCDRNNASTFSQVNVLMRHELAHYLMQHEMRMIHELVNKYGEEGAAHLMRSKTLHEILNIIEDMEISNKRYSKKDKETVEKMKLWGQVIGGIVTENIRKNWQSMTLIDMYKELNKEIEDIQKGILASWTRYNDDGVQIDPTDDDYIKYNVKTTLYCYTNVNARTNFLGTLPNFIKNKAVYHFWVFDRPDKPCILPFEYLDDTWKEILKAICDEFSENEDYTKQNLRDLITEIAKSSPIEPFFINGRKKKKIAALYSPEDKLIATDALKACIPFLETYNTWYNKVTTVLSDAKYSKEDLEAILAAIN